MNGRKFVIYFVAVMILTGAGLSLWIKQAYSTRPKVEIAELTKESATEPAKQ